jgi:hypothetical protein
VGDEMRWTAKRGQRANTVRELEVEPNSGGVRILTRIKK